MNPVAPNQSQAHLALRQCASSAALEPALRRFLWEINAHWQLVALPIVADNVREMLELAQENWDLDLVDWGLESWPKVLDWIAENKSELAVEAGGGFASGFSAKGEHPVMREGILRHSVYATLCNSHVNPRWMETYRLLQAHLLLANIAVTRQHTSCAEYESYADLPALLEDKANPYQAALAVRLISESWSAVLLRKLEDSVRLPPLKFLPELVYVVPSATGDINRYQHLVTFLSKAFHQSVQKKHRPSDGGGSDSRRKRFHGGRTDFLLAAQSTDVSLEDEDDKRNTRRGRHSTTVRIRHKGVQVEERLDIDDCPGEDEEDDELDSTDFEDTDFQRSPGSFHEVSAAEAMQVQMANQNFPWSYGALTINEIVPLIWQRSQQMANILANSVLTSEQLEELEVLALAQVMFWTSSSLAQARGLKVLHRTTSGRSAMLSLLPKTGTRMTQWRIRSPLPNYRRPQTAVPLGMDRARIDYLHLPDVADGSFLVQAFVRRKTRFQANENSRSTVRRRHRTHRCVFSGILSPGIGNNSNLSSDAWTRIHASRRADFPVFSSPESLQHREVICRRPPSSPAMTSRCPGSNSSMLVLPFPACRRYMRMSSSACRRNSYAPWGKGLRNEPGRLPTRTAPI